MFNPRDHLIQIRGKDGTMKPYYPAGWRLYQLVLEHPDANFETEVVYLDAEKNLAVVKVRLYVGVDYASSGTKTEAVKSGRLDQIDRVETAAKARCCINFGISTESVLMASKPAKLFKVEKEA